MTHDDDDDAAGHYAHSITRLSILIFTVDARLLLNLELYMSRLDSRCVAEVLWYCQFPIANCQQIFTSPFVARLTLTLKYESIPSGIPLTFPFIGQASTSRRHSGKRRCLGTPALALHKHEIYVSLFIENGCVQFHTVMSWLVPNFVLVVRGYKTFCQ